MKGVAVLAVSSVLVFGSMPAYAQTAGDVLQGIGRQLNGEPNPPRDPNWRDREWRDQQRERAYHHEQRRLDAEQRDLDARRRALHDERRYDDGGFYGPSR